MTSNELLVLTSRHVVLPNVDQPTRATIEVNLETGKIIAVHQGLKEREEYTSLSGDRWIDVGDKYILPGLVE